MQAQTAELNTDIKKTLRETMNLDCTNDEYVARLTRYTEQNTNVNVSWSNWIKNMLIPFIIVIFLSAGVYKHIEGKNPPAKVCYIVTNETHSSQMLHCEAQRWNNTCTKEIEEITSSEAKSLNKSINEIKMVLKTFPEQQWRQEIIQIKENIQAVNNFKERFEQELNKIDVQIEQIKTDYKAMMQEKPDIKMRITSLEFKIERVENFREKLEKEMMKIKFQMENTKTAYSTLKNKYVDLEIQFETITFSFSDTKCVCFGVCLPVLVLQVIGWCCSCVRLRRNQQYRIGY